MPRPGSCRRHSGAQQRLPSAPPLASEVTATIISALSGSSHEFSVRNLIGLQAPSVFIFLVKWKGMKCNKNENIFKKDFCGCHSAE